VGLGVPGRARERGDPRWADGSPVRKSVESICEPSEGSEGRRALLKLGHELRMPSGGSPNETKGAECGDKVERGGIEGEEIMPSIAAHAASALCRCCVATSSEFAAADIALAAAWDVQCGSGWGRS
jgi:hypothetical protein